MSARVIEVIEVEEARGVGTEADRCRIVTVYYTLKGKWLAERDPCPVITPSTDLPGGAPDARA